MSKASMQSVLNALKARDRFQDAEMKRFLDADDEGKWKLALTWMMDAVNSTVTMTLANYDHVVDGYGNEHSQDEVCLSILGGLVSEFEQRFGIEYLPKIVRAVRHRKGEEASRDGGTDGA